MNREYHKAYSQELQRDMEALVFGHAGTPILVFPTSMGRFFEYEDRGMIGVLAPKIERGELQVFCPDAVDTESWYNKGVHPRVRVMRHLQYERYILLEFLPFVRWKNQTPRSGGDGMQLWRISRGELCIEASRCGDALCEHERGIRHSSVSGWVLR
jgi:esterase/lipase superfamily enzyme